MRLTFEAADRTLLFLRDLREGDLGDLAILLLCACTKKDVASLGGGGPVVSFGVGASASVQHHAECEVGSGGGV